MVVTRRACTPACTRTWTSAA
ncbi:hypothetical protein ACTIVE_3519 [Actinomadura verrucosospora]|uniref:Uncharacterized protein n=1 Tax=Actinomadura verrucosospora TaxID=46165 RepID=A0A7D3ZK41_ACTVE|nr:hypothetical protein ACTIVE_3519 [Actinomadura verrucosospora]